MSFTQLPAKRFLPNQIELSNYLRSNWVDTTRWLRSLIMSRTMNFGDREAIEKRLRRTADETAAFYSQYYGPEVGNRARDIYLGYFQHVEDMIEAYMNSDVSTITKIQQAMYNDASEIATLLSRANRYWDEPTLETLYDAIVNATENQIASLAAGDYEKNVEAYDEYLDQAYRIADETTYGILKQFQI